MATTIFNEVVHALGLFCLFLLMHKGDAYEFVVGGQKGWSVPSDPNCNPYNQWAQKSRFQIGDSLVFNYPSGQDSVIEVNSQDYESCNTDASSEKKCSDGHTVIKLSQSGRHFFISGNKNSCLKNEKLVVIVMADRTNKNSNTNQTSTPPSPSPSPSSVSSPSPSPLPTHSTESLVPSPAPPQQGVPLPPPPSGTVLTPAPSPPPPSGTEVNNPTSAPVSEPPPPNAASSILVNFVGSVGALIVGSILVFSI